MKSSSLFEELGWKSKSVDPLLELLEGGLGGKFKNYTFFLVSYLTGIDAVAKIY